MNKKQIVLEGGHFSILKTFYDEVEHVFTKDLGWKIGRNLDAFNDLLRGGFGVHESEEPIDLVWKNSEKIKVDLGIPETLKYYKKMLEKCHPSNIPDIKKKMKDLEDKMGQTLFNIIMEIILGHEHVNFIAQ